MGQSTHQRQKRERERERERETQIKNACTAAEPDQTFRQMYRRSEGPEVTAPSGLECCCQASDMTPGLFPVGKCYFPPLIVDCGLEYTDVLLLDLGCYGSDSSNSNASCDRGFCTQMILVACSVLNVRLQSPYTSAEKRPLAEQSPAQSCPKPDQRDFT